eukprot:TRINITY_DN23424_c0_g1_i1.p2 TRINITY_DN23424_c0_g1~~TRINITY_DN23424_c0_g1_i1.p2  ORF type:complete len:511 (-),score=170.86 TRINITY_DN23424_c0_g1_i1:83-1615(-)
MDALQNALAVGRFLLPKVKLQIKSPTHAALLLGSAALALLLMGSVYNMLHFRCRSSLCAKELLTVYFLFPCVTYVIWAVGTYDDRVMEKEAEINDQKKELADTYSEFLGQMHDMLADAQESAATMAERNFESKRRAFLRFLEHAKGLFNPGASLDEVTPLKRRRIGSGGSSAGEGSTAEAAPEDTVRSREAEDIASAFRSFVCAWLDVFAESSVDPLRRPNRPVDARRLDRCSSVEEIAETARAQLLNAEVNVVRAKADEDTSLLDRLRGESERLRERLASDALAKEERTPVRHLKVGDWYGLGFGEFGPDDGYPVEVKLGYASFTLISPEYEKLLAGFVVVWIVAMIEFVHVLQTSWTVVIGLVVGEVCIAALLYHFEEIDRVQQMSRELFELTSQAARVEEHRREMKAFWEGIQELVDLWVYRTQPRLSIIQELCGGLEDTAPEERSGALVAANAGLTALEKSLPKLSAWRGGGSDFGPEERKEFGRRLMDACDQREFGNILKAIEGL